ncbi:MAG: hypothetical protein KDH20_01735 [Rhodocyclaceae bacterium]|nr:hypothetical protein [Rhodocyclaceae bacterium]
MKSARYRLALWLAMPSVRLGALAPTVSQALAARAGPAAFDICVSGDAGGVPGQPASGATVRTRLPA